MIAKFGQILMTTVRLRDQLQSKNNLKAIPYEEGEGKEEVNTLGFYAVNNRVTGAADDGDTKWNTIMNKR